MDAPRINKSTLRIRMWLTTMELMSLSCPVKVWMQWDPLMSHSWKQYHMLGQIRVGLAVSSRSSLTGKGRALTNKYVFSVRRKNTVSVNCTTCTTTSRVWNKNAFLHFWVKLKLWKIFFFYRFLREKIYFRENLCIF